MFTAENQLNTDGCSTETRSKVHRHWLGKHFTNHFTHKVNLTLACLLATTLLAACSEPIIVPQSSKFSSWSLLFTTAKREAEKVDPSTVLVMVQTQVDQCDMGPASLVLFTFIGSSGSEVEVDIEDSDPPSRALVDKKPANSQVITQEQREGFRAKADAVKIGPREACAAVLGDHNTYAPPALISMYAGEDDPLPYSNLWKVTASNTQTKQWDTFSISTQDASIVKKSDGVSTEHP